MRLLLDTHAFIWWFEGSDHLPAPARAAISDESNDVFISAASAWEIATKHRVGRLGGVDTLALNVPEYIASQRFERLFATVEDAVRAGSLRGRRRAVGGIPTRLRRAAGEALRHAGGGRVPRAIDGWLAGHQSSRRGSSSRLLEWRRSYGALVQVAFR